MKRTVFTKQRAIEFESKFTDNEVRNLLSEVEGTFAASLQDQWGRLSQTQMNWAHYLVFEAAKPKPEPVKFVRAWCMMKLAQQESGLKFPKIRIQFNGLALRLSIAGPASRYPGSVNVVGQENKLYYGRIHTDGRWEPAYVCTETVLDNLRRFNADPVAAAEIYGRNTGRCCFCGKELTRNDSISVGYGPICAGRFGLPHPYNKVA